MKSKNNIQFVLLLLGGILLLFSFYYLKPIITNEHFEISDVLLGVVCLFVGTVSFTNSKNIF